MTDATLVIGVGNEFRRDDGAGVEVAERIERERIPGVVVKVESGEGASLMEAWAGAERVILVDAVSSGASVGTLHVLDPLEQPIPSEFFHYSTHAFSVAEAVEMARALGRLPRKMTIYGIEGVDYRTGQGFSPEVERSVAEVHRMILNQLGVSETDENA